ncbi:hypothetical protein AC792_01965 [Arthrobacter sp. RIT-PI-e]|uniref:FAD-dependent oxidoreductase n=1 Tax=Arthrobacter sp. RIT-PI-e TaxID=1681197 RepID=UPI000676530F|nr:NAD(P)/FAD-dependent oxidoreductase [Arthrobacter sp. RIT-PI-e]KNC20294.1 hypothetical protein AC792_01965 [Arthrobacter sp. RIT-PI-e]
MHDVIVVGGGPVGLYTALLLRRAGVDAVVLERRTERSRHSRAIGIHPPALRALGLDGVADELRARGIRIRDGVARSAGRHVGTVSFSTLPGDEKYVLAVPQAVTEEILERRLEEDHPGCLVRGVEVTGVEERAGHVRVAISSEGTDTVVEARLLVAADGARSSVRENLAIGAPARRYPDCYVMGDFHDSTDDGDDAVLYLEAGGIVESFPLPGHIRRWVVRLGAPLADPTAGRLADLVGQRTGGGGGPAPNSMLWAVGVQARLADRVVSGRTVLIGDAAHEISPIGGQGMNLGWLDAVDLAPIITASLRDGREVGGGLRRYERERRTRARAARAKAEINMVLGRPLPAYLLRPRNRLLGTLIRNRTVHRGVARAFTMQ